MSCDKQAKEILETPYGLSEQPDDEGVRRMLEKERMAAISKTTTVVGHNLRNPLQSILNNLYLARKQVESFATSLGNAKIDGLKDILGTIEKQALYMDKIVTDLHDYARPYVLKVAKTHIHALIAETLSTTMIPSNVKISVETEDAGSLMVDSLLMKRALGNLITNAVEAMPRGGQLTIKSLSSAGRVSVSIRDTGVGIAKEDLGKIFNPLFTTKSKGQGLGLPVCKRIIKAHSGMITVESEVGKGSTFTILLPLESS